MTAASISTASFEPGETHLARRRSTRFMTRIAMQWAHEQATVVTLGDDRVTDDEYAAVRALDE
jgi:hypothetical protein